MCWSMQQLNVYVCMCVNSVYMYMYMYMYIQNVCILYLWWYGRVVVVVLCRYQVMEGRERW